MRNKASTDMRELVLEIGGPVQGSENRKSWLARIARTVGISRRSTAAAFYGEIRGEVHRAGVEAKLRAALAQQNTKAASNELGELYRRMAVMEQRLQQIDPDFHGPTINQVRASMRSSGGVDCAGD